jgi:hypothetical protein
MKDISNEGLPIELDDEIGDEDHGNDALPIELDN